MGESEIRFAKRNITVPLSQFSNDFREQVMKVIPV